MLHSIIDLCVLHPVAMVCLMLVIYLFLDLIITGIINIIKTIRRKVI